MRGRDKEDFFFTPEPIGETINKVQNLCNVDLSKMMISNHTNNNHSDISNIVSLSCVHDDGSIESIVSICAPNNTISLLPNEHGDLGQYDMLWSGS